MSCPGIQLKMPIASCIKGFVVGFGGFIQCVWPDVSLGVLCSTSSESRPLQGNGCWHKPSIQHQSLQVMSYRFISIWMVGRHCDVGKKLCKITDWDQFGCSRTWPVVGRVRAVPLESALIRIDNSCNLQLLVQLCIMILIGVDHFICACLWCRMLVAQVRSVLGLAFAIDFAFAFWSVD